MLVRFRDIYVSYIYMMPIYMYITYIYIYTNTYVYVYIHTFSNKLKEYPIRYQNGKRKKI
jgi:hypothetical protein